MAMNKYKVSTHSKTRRDQKVPLGFGGVVEILTRKGQGRRTSRAKEASGSEAAKLRALTTSTNEPIES